MVHADSRNEISAAGRERYSGDVNWSAKSNSCVAQLFNEHEIHHLSCLSLSRTTKTSFRDFSKTTDR